LAVHRCAALASPFSSLRSGVSLSSERGMVWMAKMDGFELVVRLFVFLMLDHFSFVDPNID